MNKRTRGHAKTGAGKRTIAEVLNDPAIANYYPPDNTPSGYANDHPIGAPLARSNVIPFQRHAMPRGDDRCVRCYKIATCAPDGHCDACAREVLEEVKQELESLSEEQEESKRIADELETAGRQLGWVEDIIAQMRRATYSDETIGAVVAGWADELEKAID